LVGGTHFYTQSLLFRETLPDEHALDSNVDGERFPILQEPTSVIMTKLKEVDPIMAGRWHPNDRRKIQRSLEIFLKTGKQASQLYDEQRTIRERSPDTASDDLASSGEVMRFPSLVFWVHASKDVLYPRLDGRVDRMLEKGLFSEVRELALFKEDYETRTGTTVDQSRGIWVSIGYKEFLDYQDALSEQSLPLSGLEQLKATAIEKTQAATRQYANRQIKWIRIKLLTALIGAGQQNKVFLLDGSDLSKWKDEVIGPAMTVTDGFLSGKDLPAPSSLSPAGLKLLTPKRDYDLGQRPDLWQKQVCEICGTVAVTENNWNQHIKSRGHRRAAGLEKKREQNPGAPEKKKQLQVDMVDMLESYMRSLPDEEEYS
jgi:tRNA dimethylallyltransferase